MEAEDGEERPAVVEPASPCLAGGSEGEFPATVDKPHKAAISKVFAETPRLGKFVGLIEELLSGHPQYDKNTAQQLCQAAEELLSREQSLLSIVTGAEEVLVVVGDIHGQFHDLITHVLSQEYDKPDERPRSFLFLGDYVDRGPDSVDVVMLLLALKVEFPSRVFLIRGNHEDSQTSRVYGFMSEAREKFGDAAEWASFNRVFCFLPLAAHVSSKSSPLRFLAMHGGLSPQLADAMMINEIPRSDYGGTLDNEYADVVDGLLWSDPSEATARFHNNDRGCGYIFGPAAAREFCEQNAVDFICRAHQMTMSGYRWTHDDKVLTIFSAPNYCGMAGNLGAIMVCDGANLQFIQFDSTESSAQNAPPSASPMVRQYF